MTTESALRRVLVIANVDCGGEEFMRDPRGTAGEAEVLIVAPALVSRLHYWMSDEDEGIAAAGRRLERSIERYAEVGVKARGAIGDADPLQALDDAARTFGPDEIIIASRRGGDENWLERGLVEQARARFDVPVTHVEVDSAADAATVVTRERPDPAAPARERHTMRDLSLLAVFGFLAIAGSLGSFVFYAVDAADWVIWSWVIVLDLGLKLVAFSVLWFLFQRRARADRLDL